VGGFGKLRGYWKNMAFINVFSFSSSSVCGEPFTPVLVP